MKELVNSKKKHQPELARWLESYKNRSQLATKEFKQKPILEKETEKKNEKRGQKRQII